MKLPQKFISWWIPLVLEYILLTYIIQSASFLIDYVACIPRTSGKSIGYFTEK